MIQDLIDADARFLFFTGKGGVGKTSLACAASVAMADAGRKVLLISTDPASNLNEVLETELGAEPRAIPLVPNLFAMNIDPNAAALAYRERIVGPYRGVLPDSAVARIEEQLSGACTTEIASFNEFSRLIGDETAVAGYDRVVLDTAPTGHALRLLNLPAAWSDFIATNESGSSCLGPLAGLKDQKANYDRALNALKDASLTSLILVARADAGSLAEAARAGSELLDAGIRRQSLVINAIFKARDESDAVAMQLQEESNSTLNNIPSGLKPLPQMQIPFRPTGAVGINRLRALIDPGFEDAEAPISENLAEPGPFPKLRELVNEIAAAGNGVVMTMGKGGVGKTSVAAQVAFQLAELGEPILLATTDPADHLTGRFSNIPNNLTIAAIDPKHETERHVQHVLETTGANLDAEARALLVEELKSPCIEEIAVFAAFAKIVAKGETQFVVLDTAPTGHTLLLLDTTEAYHREVARGGGNLSNEVQQLLPRLRDPEFTRILVVALPEATPVHEAASLQTDLRRAGIEPYAWIVNRSLATTSTTDPQLAAKRRNERPYIAEIETQLARRIALIPISPSAVKGA